MARRPQNNPKLARRKATTSKGSKGSFMRIPPRVGARRKGRQR